MSQEQIEALDRAFLDAWYDVSDEELVARMNACPDNGGALVARLSEFAANRVEREVA